MDLFDIHRKLATIDFIADLYDPYDSKQTGRTHYLAYAFIKLALKYPNQKIRVHDHIIHTDRAAEYMYNRLLLVTDGYDCLVPSRDINNRGQLINRDVFYITYNPIIEQDFDRDKIWISIINKFENQKNRWLKY